MTTDVINNVPRELLEQAAHWLNIHGDTSSVEESVAQDLRALLATAQPAADGERATQVAFIQSGNGMKPTARIGAPADLYFPGGDATGFTFVPLMEISQHKRILAAQPAKAEGVAVPVVDREFRKFTTSEGGRGYVAEWFKTVLSRYDYTRYINERLAADFACTLANALYQLAAAPVPPVRSEGGDV